MPTVDRFPQHNDSNGWWSILDAPKPATPLSADISVRTAIIGAGICGLSTANRLGELCPNDDICLIDANQIGYGTSGRNAGFILNLHSHGLPKDLSILKRNRQLWDAGFSSLRHKVVNKNIGCDWSETGRYYGAAGPDGEKHLDEITQTLGALDVDFQQLDSSALQKRIGTRFYSQGLFVRGNALVNPAALMRGLASHLPTNIRVFENTPVLGFKRSGSGYRIATAHGIVTSERLVLAAGVFLKDFGIARAHYVPIATYASLSQTLDDNAMISMGTGKEFGLLASSDIGSTIRLTRDNRLFVRNTIKFEPGKTATPKLIRKISEAHRRALVNRWPKLANVRFEHTWGGVMAFTTNDGAVFGEYGNNLFAVLTNDVSPITRGAAAGELLAEFMQGHSSELLTLQLSIPSAQRVPPRPFLDLGILCKQGKMKWLSGNEL